jgi:hypothetical protein
MSLNEKMTALADAVRSKANRSDTLTIDAMTAAVNGLVVGTPSTQTLTVIPTKEKQTFSSSDLGSNTYYSVVTVNAIPSEYITTADATASTYDILEGETAYVKGSKVTGRIKNYGDVTETFSNASDLLGIKANGYFNTITVNLTRKTLEITPTKSTQTLRASSEGSDVFYTQVNVAPIPSEYTSTADATAVRGDILEGKTAYVNGEKLTGVYKDVSAEDVRWGTTYGVQMDYVGSVMHRIGSFTGDATAEAEHILEGKTAYALGVKVTGTLKSVTATLSGNVVTIPQGVIAEEQIVTVPEMPPVSIYANAISIGPGYNPELKSIKVGNAVYAQTYIPGTADITLPKNSFLVEAQTIKGDSDLTASNIKSGVSIFNVSGTFTSDATATASDIAKDKTAYVNGVKVTGTSEGGETFYKCTEVFGPKTVTFLSVTGAGTEDCNGRYDEAGTKNGATIYSYTSSSGATWYIYYISSEWDENGWVLADNTNVSWIYGGHYHAYSLSDSWYMGEAGASEPAPSVVKGSEVINASQPRTWNGIKAKKVDGYFFFGSDITTGLTYGTSHITPIVGNVYDSVCSLQISRLWRNLQIMKDGALFALDSSDGTDELMLGGKATFSGSGDVLQGGVFCFDSVRNLCYESNKSLSGLDEFTVEFDCSITGNASGYAGIFCNHTSWTYGAFIIQWGRYDVKPSLHWNGVMEESFGDDCSSWINDGQFHHIAIVKDANNTINGFTDGAMFNLGSTSTVLNLNAVESLWIGYNKVDNAFFPGRIKHFRISSKALYTSAFPSNLPSWVGK